MSSPDPQTMERLLAERGWLRRLAGDLVRDHDLADDLTQDTYVQALRHAPAAVRRPRAWLRTVIGNLVRNQARGEARRRSRERHAVPTTETESTAVVVERAELIERVAKLVLDLPEPYRTTLLLRYFEDAPPRAVAARMDVPVETVRTRVRRGLERLATGLDEAHGGRRRAWAAPLAAWAGGAAGVMGMKKVAFVAVVVLVLGLGVLAWQRGAFLDAEPPPVPGDERAEAPGGPLEDAPAAEDEPSLHGAATATAAPSAPTGDEAAGLRFQGVVTYPDGRPAAGVMVEALSLHRATRAATTDAAGRYDLKAGPRPTRTLGILFLRAADDVGRAGIVDVYLWHAMPASSTVGPLVLSAAKDLRVLVTAEDEPAAGARIAISPLRWSAWEGMREIGADGAGRAVLASVPDGSYRIDASHPRLGRTSRVVTLPVDAAGEIVLSLGEAGRSLDVTVVEEETRRPIEGARLEVYEAFGPARVGQRGAYLPAPRIPRTDAEGRSRIQGLDPHARLVVVAWADGFPPVAPCVSTMWRGITLEPPEEVAADAASIEVVLLRKTEVRWPIEEGDPLAPPDGTTLVMQWGEPPDQLEHEGRVEDGHVVTEIYPTLGYRGLAVAPDGARAFAYAYPGRRKEPPTVSFWRPRTIEVLLHHPDGSPAAGVRLQVGQEPSFGNRFATTDASGLAVFEDLPKYNSFQVHLVPPYAASVGGGNPPLGRVKAGEDGGGRLDATVRRTRDVTLRVLVGGEPRLPGDLVIRRGGTVVERCERDAGRGEVRFEVRPSGTGRPTVFQLSATGYAHAVARLPTDDEQTPVVVDVSMEPTARMYVRVKPAPDRMSTVQVHRWFDAAEAWGHGGNRVEAGGGLADVTIWRDLQAGRYRVVDVASDVGSEPFEVDPASEPTVVTLDLRQVVAIEGRVSVPEGFQAAGTVIEVVGRPAPIWRHPVPGAVDRALLKVDRDGRFALRLRADAVETLEVSHPQLWPKDGRERITVRGTTPRIDVVLVEGRRAIVRFAADTPPALPERNMRRKPVTIHLYGDSLHQEPYRSYELEPEDGAVRFGGFDPGTYDVWIDAWPYAPVLLEDVELAEGETELGPLRLEEGCRIRLRLLLADDAEPPRFQLSAWAREDPTYWRTAQQKNGTEVVLFGLRPGAYRVRGMLNEGGRTLFDERMRLEGPDEVVRVIDLR